MLTFARSVVLLRFTPPIHVRQAKLCDFGCARPAKHARYYKRTGSVRLVPFTAVQGTHSYRAPELMKQKPFTAAIDMWALGLVLYEALCGFGPFYPYHRCLDPGKNLEFPERYWGGVSAAAQAR